MAALCTGPTEQQPGVPSYVRVGNLEAHAYYSNASIAFKWMIDRLLPGTKLITTQQLCSVDPGTPTPLEVTDFLSLDNVWAKPEAVKKMEQAAMAYAFAAYCQCAAGTEVEDEVLDAQRSAGTTFVAVDIAIPASVHSVYFWAQNLGPVSAHWEVLFGNADWSQFAYEKSGVFGYPLSYGDTRVLEGWETQVRLNLKAASGTVSFHETVIFHSLTEDPYVPTLPAPPEEPEGMPDPPAVTECEPCDLRSMMEHMSDQIWDVRQRVNEVLSRDPTYPPTATPTETPVTSGPMAVSGIRAAVVEYSVPAWMGSIVGDPPIDLLVGYVSVRSEEGWHPPIRLEHNPQVIDPLPSNCTEIAVSLTPGVTATLKTFEREEL
jgi:hypothetical protein